jgi:hypothetical protein
VIEHRDVLGDADRAGSTIPSWPTRMRFEPGLKEGRVAQTTAFATRNCRVFVRAFGQPPQSLRRAARAL